jgi:transposase
MLTATAAHASAGDAREFASGRSFSACLGLTPKQHSSGGRVMLLGISKRGDGYLRGLLVHGARAVVRHAQARIEAGKESQVADPWLVGLLKRRPVNVAVVALAAKNARRVWALLRYPQRVFDPRCGVLQAAT